jgi:hypothetical protein
MLEGSSRSVKQTIRPSLPWISTTARDEVDLDALAIELLRVVAETTQPQGVSVWLFDPKDAHLTSLTDTSHEHVCP